MLLAATEIPAAPVLIFMALGVLIALFGHANKSRGWVLTGLMILFVATAAMVASAYVAYNENPNEDPRPKRDPKEPTF